MVGRSRRGGGRSPQYLDAIPWPKVLDVLVRPASPVLPTKRRRVARGWLPVCRLVCSAAHLTAILQSLCAFTANAVVGTRTLSLRSGWCISLGPNFRFRTARRLDPAVSDKIIAGNCLRVSQCHPCRTLHPTSAKPRDLRRVGISSSSFEVQLGKAAIPPAQ